MASKPCPTGWKPEGGHPAPAGYGGAQIMRELSPDGWVCVTAHADERIAATDELMALATAPGAGRTPGDIECDGDLVSFGVPGMGLGRLTYRIVGRVPGYHLLQREEANPKWTVKVPDAG